jgi:hypothetical protein
MFEASCAASVSDKPRVASDTHKAVQRETDVSDDLNIISNTAPTAGRKIMIGIKLDIPRSFFQLVSSSSVRPAAERRQLIPYIELSPALIMTLV